MIEPLRTALLRLINPTGLLALVTALVLLIASLLRVDSNGLLILALVYALVGVAGIYWRRRSIVSAAPDVQAESQVPEALGADDLNELATRMLVTVDGLVRAAEAINEVATQQAGGASEQVDVIHLTNTLMEDFLKLSERINEQARSVTETAQQAAEISGRGQAAIRDAIEGMDTIRVQVEAIGTTIMGLAMLTRKVDEIISSVSEIATQSNLLALNASIEAARAGAHGRGFAVVADEVRALAQQSTQAAQQVGAILVNIQTAMKETVKATEMGMQGVDAGMNKTQEANTVMVQLAANVNASHDAVRAIYEVIRQQADGLEEIAISMERIDRITQQNLASTRMVETVSTNLTRLASDLQQTVEQSQQLAAG